MLSYFERQYALTRIAPRPGSGGARRGIGEEPSKHATSLRTLDADFSHQWFWDGREHVDPAKEANAQATRLMSHTTTLANEYAKQGRDWEAELRQRAKEIELMEELGLAVSVTEQPNDKGPNENEAQEQEEFEQAAA